MMTETAFSPAGQASRAADEAKAGDRTALALTLGAIASARSPHEALAFGFYLGWYLADSGAAPYVGRIVERAASVNPPA